MHEQRVPRDRRTHAVRVLPDTRTRTLLGAERLMVNSFHHQSIRELGDGLLATGWAEDGVIEAAEVADGGWVVGVQWHPESFHAEAASPDWHCSGLMESAMRWLMQFLPARDPAMRSADRTGHRSLAS
jgi:putative glutamine amidotransferase